LGYRQDLGITNDLAVAGIAVIKHGAFSVALATAAVVATAANPTLAADFAGGAVVAVVTTGADGGGDLTTQASAGRTSREHAVFWHRVTAGDNGGRVNLTQFAGRIAKQGAVAEVAILLGGAIQVLGAVAGSLSRLAAARQAAIAQ
jgi:hypothetical protein